MNDPHVVALYYQLTSKDRGESFKAPPPIATTLGPFDVTLHQINQLVDASARGAGERVSQDLLEAIPHEHYADEQSARDALEPFLRAWEARALLDAKRFRVRFEFQRSEIIDRAPPQDEAQHVYVRGHLHVSATTMLLRINQEYPSPDPAFALSPRTHKLVNRFTNYRDESEPLLSMAYFILTELEREFGGGKTRAHRKDAARVLNVDPDVLCVLGELTARADPKDARKAHGDTTPLTETERSWIEEVVVRLIRRVGEYDAHPSALAFISMSDFPTL